MRFARGVFSFALSAVCFSFVAWGQATTSLRGHVTDSTGAVIPGAQLSLTLTATGIVRHGTTDASGEYQFLQLTPGEYTLKASKEGFTAAEKRGMNLLVGQPATEDVMLTVASITEQVQNRAGPGKHGCSARPEHHRRDAGQCFCRKQIQSLPIEGRNVPDLLSLQPGVTYLGRTDENNGTQAAGNNDQDSRSAL